MTIAPPKRPTTTPTRLLTNRVPPKVCPRILFYAPEGFGKTTFAAFAPDPVILMARDETGVDRLLQSRSIPELPAVTCETWSDLIGWLDDLIVNPQGRRTVVLDALGGFERLCMEHCIATHYNGSADAFDAYGKGYKVHASEWMKMLGRLDQLNRRGIVVVLLAHSVVKAFDDPQTVKYDRYRIDLSEHVGPPTMKWADAVLFGNYFTVVSKENEKAKKGKALGGKERHVYTERTAAFDAKNGYRMPPDIALPDEPEASWSTVWQFIEESTTQTQGA